METLNINNPFGGSVFYIEQVNSTMDQARILLHNGVKTGSLIVADEQISGRGRGSGRVWHSQHGKNLLFTLIMHYENLPAALSLRTGLALARTVEEYIPDITGRIAIKWPNDVLVDSKKIAGILIEVDQDIIYIGIGINVGQTTFEPELQTKTNSIACIMDRPLEPEFRFLFLERILAQLFREFSTQNSNWHNELERYLYRRGEYVKFKVGSSESTLIAEGILQGINSTGSLCIINSSGEKSEFSSGELIFTD
ncbi:biotin--[acetyl-CoA-carboxylase] ligase [Spirochaetia bacterium]|nr:biotin--[acetyl-CoA-carboxylase] ligase [Spirochaetia bacterium]